MAIYSGSKPQSIAGKSAYQLAVEGGYEGSEEEFKELLYNLPNYGDLGTAALKDVPTSGDASSTQVVLGSDTRLTKAKVVMSATEPTDMVGGDIWFKVLP